MDLITVGVRYEPLSGAMKNSISAKHWALVFSGPEFGFRIEAGPSPEPQKEIHFRTTPCLANYGAFKIGTYYGEWSDLREILQHFVASYLVFLEAYANRTYSRSFNIQYNSRYDDIHKVLNKDQNDFWHEPNMFMGTLNFAPIPTAGFIAGAALVAAEATVPTTVAGGGIAGWLGFTTTVIAPAAYAGFAALCAPVAAVGTGVAGAAYLMRRREWKRNTLFSNPLISGFPNGYFPALSFPERTVPLSAKENFFSTHSALMASAVSTGVVGVAGYAHNPAAVGAQRAEMLSQMAERFIV